MIFPPLYVMAILAGELRHAEVSQEKQCVEVHYVGANAAETTPGR
jgi:hypothetical protein